MLKRISVSSRKLPKKKRVGALIKKQAREKKLLAIGDKSHVQKLRASRKEADEKVKITLRQKKLRKKELSLKEKSGGLTKHEEKELAKLRAMQSFTNKQMPTMVCSNCAFSNQCPQYKPDHVCYYTPFLNSHKIETVDDILNYAKQVATQSVRRVHMMQIIESFRSGVPTSDTTEAMQLAFSQLTELEKRITEREQMEAEENEIEVEADGSLLGQLFSGLDSLKDKTAKARSAPIDTTHKGIMERHAIAKAEALEESANMQQAIDEVTEEERAANRGADKAEIIDAEEVVDTKDKKPTLDSMISGLESSPVSVELLDPATLEK